MNNSKVKVAVRVRPLNQREEGLNSECVVRVSGNQITLLPPISSKEKARKEPHTFIYDNCFWTEDRHETGQKDVFEHLGDGALENIWLGFNVCIFAYGQTGSGKTFSMMGTDDQPGIVPRICSALFNKESNDLETIRIEASYFEIYNEEVRDLLRSEKKQKNLRVREDRLLGPYVEELSCHAVQSYGEMKLLLDQGNKQRAIAETKMNEQSSRSHSILSLTVTQTCNDHKSGASRELVSKAILVDLAGSERSYKSGAQGSQLKESCNINKSLLTLGLVINSLAEISENKRKSQYVNYRDSVLTWLLKNNLGGNSKTIMLATVSPAADNYQETLSTLRYAESAKRIVNQAVVNEDVKSKAIEELQEEIKRLREQLTTTEQVKAEVQELKLHLEEKENLLRDLKTLWEEKLKRTEVATQEWKKNIENMSVSLNKQDVTFSNQCYLIQRGAALIIYNINDITKIGSGPSQDIQISGPEAECVIRKTEEGEVFLTPVDTSKTYVNGFLSKTKTQLWHEDKIQIGTNVFILHLPNRPKPDHMKTNVSIEGEVPTYDELNTENDISPILSKRDSWNSSVTEGEKSKTNSTMSENHKTSEGFTQTIPVSNDDYNSSENKQISDIFTEISNKTNSTHNNVNTTGNTHSEYREIGVGTQVQHSMVQCSPQYGEVGSQTSKTLQSSNYFQNTPHQEYKFTLPSNGQMNKSPGFFCWDKNTEIQWLQYFLPQSSIPGASLCCILHPPGEDWKTLAERSSPIILCHSFTTNTEWTCLEEFLTYCRSYLGKRVIVIVTDVKDRDSEESVNKKWRKWKFSDCDLITLTCQEMGFISTYTSKDLSPERRMARKFNSLKNILQTTAVGRDTIGIFSRSHSREYSWLVKLLTSVHFSGCVQRATPYSIENYKFEQFRRYVSQCTFGILYHTKNSGKINMTDVTSSLYDKELEYLHKNLGRDNVIVVIDDLEESTDQVKDQILKEQHSIQKWARDLFIFCKEEKNTDPRIIPSMEEKMKRLEIMITGFNSSKEQSTEKKSLTSLANKAAKHEPQIPACQNFGAEIPEFQYSMNYKKLGMCIIINNKKFDDSKKLSVRDGTDKDAEDLSRCFGDLGFEATIHNNLSCEEMKRLLKSVAKSDHSDSACFACILLSHGKEGQICGTDGAIPINTLTKHFRGDQCRSLLGKPKLFFIQACRGPKKDEGVVADSEPADSSLEEDANPGSRIPVEADFLFVYATVPGYVSWRDTERGTWFIQALCEVLNQYWNLLDILQMLTRVNNQVANKPGQIKQMPSVDSRLTKSLYFKMFHTVNPSGSNIIRKQGGKPISF